MLEIFFFQAEDGIRDYKVTGVQTCALPIFRTDRMRRAAGEHFSTATDLADYLVRKGLPFRQAHEVVGRVVRHALDEGKALEDLTLAELRHFSPLIDGDVKDAITVEASLRARAATGGTAPGAVRRSLALARTLIAQA